MFVATLSRTLYMSEKTSEFSVLNMTIVSGTINWYDSHANDSIRVVARNSVVNDNHSTHHTAGFVAIAN